MEKKLPVRLQIHKDVRAAIIAAAEEERRQPNVMLNVLLAWALEQQSFLDFDLSKLCKVHLSVSALEHLDEPWKHVVSNEIFATDGGEEGQGFPEEIWEELGGR
jgi:hypothetical protein